MQSHCEPYVMAHTIHTDGQQLKPEGRLTTHTAVSNHHVFHYAREAKGLQPSEAGPLTAHTRRYADVLVLTALGKALNGPDARK